MSVLFLPYFVLGQKTNIQFERISVEHGLSQSVVSCILQDSRGFMWIGTEDGLNKYDGYTFTVYQHDPRDPASLSDNFIMCLFEDRSGMLWIGTQVGLNRFDPASEIFAHFQHDPNNPESLSNNEVYAILEDREGALWIGTRNGLNRFDRENERFTHFFSDPNTPLGLSHHYVQTLYEDRSGVLWVGTDGGGLNRFDPSKQGFIHYRNQKNNPQSLSDDRIISIHEDRMGTLWVGTYKGLNKLEHQSSFLEDSPITSAGGRFEHYLSDPAYPRGLHNYEIRTIHEDKHGNLWLGTFGGGLIKMVRTPEGERFVHYRHDPANPRSLSHDWVFSFYEDRWGVFWIGTYGSGLNKFDQTTVSFVHYRRNPAISQSLSDNWVFSLHEDREGVLWIGTYGGGLNKLERGKGQNLQYKHFKRDGPDSPGPQYDLIWAIHEDQAGMLWLGTEAGLSRFAPMEERFAHFLPESNSLNENNRIYCIHEDLTGALWLGTRGWLNHFDKEKGRFTPLVDDEVDRDHLDHRIYVIHEDPDEAGRVLWLGTNDGLKKFERRDAVPSHLPPSEFGFVSYRYNPADPHSLSHNRVYCIYEDPWGLFWLGTHGGGLNRFDRAQESFVHYGEEEGLTDDVIYGILPDGLGFLWLSTNNGLVKFDPQTESFKKYDARDGLQNSAFNHGAFFKSQSGEMFFGGIEGFTAFFPDRIVDHHQPPLVTITDFLLFNRSVPLKRKDPSSPLQYPIGHTQALVLSHQQSAFSFEFAALHFAVPERNQYAFMLEGFDKDWIYTDAKNRMATYTHLNQGDYVFRVKASNKDGVWNEEGASVKLTILPPPWKTWWAYGLYVVATAAIAFGMVNLLWHKRKLAYERALNQRLREYDNLKDEFLANTSHEFRTPLQGIIGLAEALLDGPLGKLSPNSSGNLRMILAAARRLDRLINDILDFSQLKYGALRLQKVAVDVRALTEVVFTLSKYLIKGKNLRLENAIEPDTPPVEADEQRLQQIMYNLVGNAIKFTESGSVRVTADQMDHQLRVRVTDTGGGIPREDWDLIFDPFKRIDDIHGKTVAGSGLGLAVTKKLVTLHGGHIGVETSSSQGTTIAFTLPISAGKKATLPVTPIITEDEEPELIPENPFATEGDFHILIVDDDAVNRKVLADHLSSQNYRVTGVADGREALNLLEKKQTFDLVLLDIMMPGIQGFEVCRYIRERYSLHELPIFFLTARGQPNDLVSGFEAGANDYLAKPVHKHELLARVQTHLQLLDIHRNLETKVAEGTREIQELIQRKSKFFTNISHEFRTPLTLIIGPLRDLLYGKSTEEKNLELHLQRMLRQAEQLSKLIDQLLDLSKLEAGQMALKPRPGNLTEFVKREVMSFTPWAERQKIALSFQADENIFTQFDSDALEKILQNLLSNAFKSTPEKGKILIILQQKEGWIQLMVKDTGIGIPKAELPFVFDRFRCVQADLPQFASSGIGLSLARELAILHGGDIEVQSEEGFGSKFTVQLPLISCREDDSPLPPLVGREQATFEEPETKPPREVEPTKVHPAPTVLIIDDHPEMRAYLQEILAKTYVVWTAENGKAGLEKAREKEPALIISDVIMPEMDGCKLCRLLKADERTNHIPILLLTVKASSKSKLTGLAALADDYLVKPFDAQELQARVGNLIQSRQTLRNRFSKQILVGPDQIRVPSAEEAFIRKVYKAMEQHYGDSRFGTLQLAAEVGSSESTLTRKIKKLTRKNPGKLLKEFRLKRAAQLLKRGAGTVSEIAYTVGYNSPHYFSKIFREMFGQTPSEYARQWKET